MTSPEILWFAQKGVPSAWQKKQKLVATFTLQGHCAHKIIFSHFFNGFAASHIQFLWHQSTAIFRKGVRGRSTTENLPFLFKGKHMGLIRHPVWLSFMKSMELKSEVSRRAVFLDSGICLDLSNGNLRDCSLVVERTLLRSHRVHPQSTDWPYNTFEGLGLLSKDDSSWQPPNSEGTQMARSSKTFYCQAEHTSPRVEGVAVISATSHQHFMNQ